MPKSILGISLLAGITLLGCTSVVSPTSEAPPAQAPVSPAPVAFVEVSAEPILAQIQQQAETLGLCPETPTTAAASTVYQQGKTYLVVRLCQMAAYQGSYEVLVGDGTAFRRLSATVLDENRQPQTYPEFSGLVTFNPQEATLTAWNKARGAGDCGTFATYRWDGEALVLQTFRAKWECDGAFTPPDTYPQIYP